MIRDSPWSPGKIISWEFKVKVKNEIKVDVKIKVETKFELGDLDFIFDICDDKFDLIFNFTLSLEPRPALTFLPV